MPAPRGEDAARPIRASGRPEPPQVRLVVAGDADHPMTAADEGWWTACDVRRIAGRPTTASGSTTTDRPRPTRGPAGNPRASTGRAARSTRRLRVGRRGLDRTAAGRQPDLRAAHRHLHPGGHPGRRDRASSTTWSRSASTWWNCCRSTRSAARTTGATTACLVRRAGELRRPARPTSGSSTPATSAGIAVIQDVVYNHLGAGGNHLPLFGPYLNDDGPQQHRGASRSTWTAPTPARCAGTSWTTSSCGCTTTMSTACGWTPCTR